MQENESKDSLKFASTGDPFDSRNYLSKFAFDADRFEKFVEKLTLKTLNNSTPLDTLWSDYSAQQVTFYKKITLFVRLIFINFILVVGEVFENTDDE